MSVYVTATIKRLSICVHLTQTRLKVPEPTMTSIRPAKHRSYAWAAMLACMAGLARSQQPAPYELVDLATPYTTFWDETRNLPTAERVAAFKKRFDQLLPGFFSIERVSWTTSEKYDARIARSFERFPQIRERYTAATAAFSKLLAPAHESFVRTFPDLKPIGPIYLVNSLNEFDGGTRQWNGPSRLMFGIDVMVQVHDFPDERPFFHHELFHVYHQQFFTGCEEVWCGLWSEGLAVLVAQRLSPQATDAQLLLDSPQPLRPAVEKDRRAAACAVASRLDSKSQDDLGGLFSSGPPVNGLPPRVGYYVGYLVAAEAAKDRSLSELAHLDNTAARERVKATLGRLARCTGSN
jgi:hypothetical protein